MGTKLLGHEEPRVAVQPGRLHHNPGNPGRDRRPAQLDGLILDACNILYDDTAWRRWLLRLLRRIGLQTNYCSFFRILDRDYLRQVHCGKCPFGEALQAFLRSAGLAQGQIDEVQAACLARRRLTERNFRLLTGVRSTLQRLRAEGVALGVLCNSEHPADALRHRLDALLGEPLWAAVVSSRDLGQAMPDAACYHAALEAMRLPAHRVGFLGHDPDELAGAAACGLPTFAFNRDPDAQADFHLDRLDDLPPLISHRAALAVAG